MKFICTQCGEPKANIQTNMRYPICHDCLATFKPVTLEEVEFKAWIGALIIGVIIGIIIMLVVSYG